MVVLIWRFSAKEYEDNDERKERLWKRIQKELMRRRIK